MTIQERIVLKNKPLIFKLKKYEVKNFLEKNNYKLKEEKNDFYEDVEYIGKNNNNIYEYIHELAELISESRVIPQTKAHNKKISKMKRCQQRKKCRTAVTRDKLFKYYLEKYCSIFLES